MPSWHAPLILVAVLAATLLFWESMPFWNSFIAIAFMCIAVAIVCFAGERVQWRLLRIPGELGLVGAFWLAVSVLIILWALVGWP